MEDPNSTAECCELETASLFSDTTRASVENWDEDEKDIFRRCKEIYMTGKPIWTKDMLKDLEEQIQRNDEFFRVPCFDGVVRPVKNRAHGDKPEYWQTELIFKGQRELVNPVKRWRMDWAFFPVVIAQHKSFWTDKQWDTMFEEYVKKWESSSVYASIKCSHAWLQTGKHTLSLSVNKLVCFGLGDISEPSNNFDRTSQHPAALTLRHLLEQYTGHKIRLLTQDPAYENPAKAGLQRHGFEVVEGNGAKAFTEIDENTVVLTIAVSACVREIIADTCRKTLPAAIICSGVEDDEVFWDIPQWFAEMDPRDRGVALFNPETVRTQIMWKYYSTNQSPFAPKCMCSEYDQEWLRWPFRTVVNIRGPVASISDEQFSRHLIAEQTAHDNKVGHSTEMDMN